MQINCRGQLIDFETPKVMGILNHTPDSFYDGGRYKTDLQVLNQVEKMLKEGADFIDIGGQSTRPTSQFLSAEEELSRILPLLKKIKIRFPEALLSVDTFYSQVARATFDYGIALINDISAGKLDDQMFATISEIQVPYVMMHMRGQPQTMQQHTTYHNLLQEILYYFSERINQARAMGINDILVDPGFGFSKTPRQNFVLLKNLRAFQVFELPVFIGISRKSTIYKTLDISPEEALNGTTALHVMCLLNGANILRVHDVKEAVQVIKLVKAYKNS